MNQSAIATAADYADALFTVRRAKNALCALVAVLIGIDIALFFLVRYDNHIAPMGLDLMKYVTGIIDFLGVAAPIVLSIALLLIVIIMLVGRLIGVSKLISALLWSIILIVLLFPWQAFLINQTFTSTDFKVPGILYTWTELAARARLHPEGWKFQMLFWARFVGFPTVALIITGFVAALSRSGLRLALGESTPTNLPDAEMTERSE